MNWNCKYQFIPLLIDNGRRSIWSHIEACAEPGQNLQNFIEECIDLVYLKNIVVVGIFNETKLYVDFNSTPEGLSKSYFEQRNVD